MARKTHNDRLDVPPLELQCMKALWALEEATVHEIQARLFPERPLAYTTVMTVMGRLLQKTLVDRHKRGRAYRYRPLVAEHVVRDRALDCVVKNFFLGSRERLQQHLSAAASAPPPETATPVPETPPQPAPASGSQENIDPSLL